MRTTLIRLLYILAMLLPALSYAQLSAPNADFADTANYSKDTINYPAGSNDSVYVFNDENTNAYLLVDTASFSGYSIEWDVFDESTGFIPSAFTDVRLDLPTSPASSGYKLRLVGADTVESVCWVLFNDFTMQIVSKDANNNITQDALTSNDCIWIGYIEAEFDQRPLNYYNPVTLEAIGLNLGHESTFETDPVPETGYGQMYEADPLNNNLRYAINNSFYKDVLYTITITDDAGLERSDDINVTAIRPFVEFKGEDATRYIRLDDRDFYPDRDTLYYRAYGGNYDAQSGPGLWLFSVDTNNVDSLIWNFGDSIYYTGYSDTITHYYSHWGTYEYYLTAINYFDFRRECTHKIGPFEARIDEPSLGSGSGGDSGGGSGSEGGGAKIQNAFTPPNGNNPIWRYDDVSITDFEIAVYNRYGRRVHYFKGNIRDWGGWDGRNNDGSNYVPTGVYYYVLKDFSEAPAFDPTIIRDGIDDSVRKGFIHVFNTE